jgi:tRNA pseudouridine55 synthase
LLDKPVGPTSFDVVARVRRALHERRAGHCGTLDPLASGLLVVCLGEATKLVPFLTDCDKSYEAVITLGRETASGDLDGPIVSEVPPETVAAVPDQAIAQAIAGLTGEIEQRPPVYSAVKVEGKPLYARVRAGEAVEAPLRRVRVDRFELLAREGASLRVRVDCGKGTYIRSLAIDLGRALGVGGHLNALRRTRVGAFPLDLALTVEALAASPDEVLRRALSPAEALPHLPRAEATEDEVRMLQQGKRPVVAWGEGRRAVVDATGRLVAVVEVGPGGLARVLRGFERPRA